jgi:DNA-binding transcriptional LysR family regulator
MALDGCGIVRVPLYAVRTEIADKRLNVIFKNLSLFAGTNVRLPRKSKAAARETSDFINFLETSLRR